jgi:SAM-dependent methyltransferase
MNTSSDSEAIFQYHRYMIELHGNQGTAALGWRDQLSQTVRFKALSTIAKLSGHSVLDAGSGYGDLCSYLLDLYSNITYCGVEQIPELLSQATHRYKDQPNVSFIQANFMTDTLPETDYVMASGSLNYYNSDPEFIFKAILKLYSHCKLGLGFNLLRHVIPNGLIVAYNADKIMNYCRSLCNHAQLKDDYSDEDFTIFMYR